MKIWLRQVKYAPRVKYLLRKWEGRISFHIATVGSNISQFPKEIISHSASAEYFTFSPSGLEKHRKLCYNKLRKAVET